MHYLFELTAKDEMHETEKATMIYKSFRRVGSRMFVF